MGRHPDRGGATALRSMIGVGLVAASLVPAVVSATGGSPPTTVGAGRPTEVVTVSGTSARLVAMDADLRRLSDVAVVDTGAGAVVVEDADALLDDVVPGSEVSVTGRAADDGSVVVESVEVVSSPGMSPHDHHRSHTREGALAGDRSILVVPVVAEGGVAPTGAALTGPMDDFVSWVGARSNASLDLTVTYAAPVVTDTVGCANSSTAETEAILQGVRDQGIDPAAADFVAFVLDDAAVVPNGLACGAAGWALQPGSLSWYRSAVGGWGLRTIAHEMGHNWGLSHSGRADCVDNATPVQMPLGGPKSAGCTWYEYGDPYSVMGQGAWLTALQQSQLGWYGPASPILENGTYQVVLTAPDATSGQRVVAVRAAHRARYWVEFAPSVELPVDGVASAPGVSIRWMRPLALDLLFSPYSYGHPHLVDAVPGSRPGDAFREPFDSVFLEGQRFDDPHGTVSVVVDDVTSTSATVTITVSTPIVLPSAPFSAYPAEGDGRVRWVFGAQEDPGDGTFRGYVVSARARRADGTWGAWSSRGPVAPRQVDGGWIVELGGVTNGVLHQTRLCPVSSYGTGTCVSGTVTPYGRAPSPPRPRVRVGSRVRVCMTVANGGGPAIDTARVQRKVGAGDWRLMTTVPISLSVETCVRIAPGTATKPVRVRYSVSNRFGWSPWSSPSTPVRPS